MRKILKRLLFIFLLLSLQACINQAFIPTGYEPSLLETKGDSRLNIGMRPISTIQLDYTRAVTDKVGVRVSPSGFIGFYAIDAGGFNYYNRKKLKIDLGGGFQYLKNFSHLNDFGDRPLIFASKYYTQRFNISFYSPYLATSIVFRQRKNLAFGFGLKGAYNFVGNYSYYQVIDSYQGFSNATPLDNESIDIKPYSFFSLESAFNIYFGEEKKIKLQLAYNYRYASLVHHYSFVQNFGSTIEATSNHPTISPITLNICFLIPYSKKKEKQ
jgi:hypothetical protein